MLHIRPSLLADGPRVVEIWRLAVDATHDFLSATDRAAIEDDVRGFLPATPLWLATGADDVALGFMLLAGARLEALFIDPAYHRRGIGSALVAHALAQQPVLDTDVNQQNTQAVRFYQRLGFIETGRSTQDGQGRAYPLLHLRCTRAPR